jgi:hypothetical protein
LDQANDRGDNNVSLKTRLIAGAGSLALATSIFGVVAPAAHAAPTPIGSCQGQLSLVKLTPALGDQTQVGIKAAGALAKDQTTKAAIAGNCTGTASPGVPARPGDPHIPQPSTALTPKALATVLVGNASCASGAGIPVDGTAALAWPLNGSLTYTMNQTYNDLVTNLVKPYKIAGKVALLGFNPGGPDLVDVGGILLAGLGVGATVTGTIWEDPVAKTGGATGYNTGYEVDIASAAGCADATPNNASISQVLSGGGGATATSLLGSSAPGISFQFGE